MPKGKIVQGSLSGAMIEYDCEGPVERDGQAVENDHSKLMKIGGQEMWVRKDYQYDGGKIRLPMQFVIDNKMDVEGVDVRQEQKSEDTPDDTVRPSLGPSQTFASGKKTGNPDDKEKGA